MSSEFSSPNPKTPQEPESVDSTLERSTDLTDFQVTDKERLIRDNVDRITDGLGWGIDAGIKETVVAFMLDDFPTTQSCEGHSDQEKGLHFPWVEVGLPYPDDAETNPQALEIYKAGNLVAQQRMSVVLNEFYETRKSDNKLGISTIGSYSAFRVQPVKDEKLINPEELTDYKAEMASLTNFIFERTKNISYNY